MKYFFLAVSAIWLTTASHSFAQTDGMNKEKYWKLRTDFREKFIKIGADNGESLPAGALKPLDCVDNDSIYDGTPFSTTWYGEMHWGDGMIRHGHYLGLLATEYRLLKNSGQDVTGILNELYYALNAINRLDKNCEPNQDVFYGMTLSQNLNGFSLREDIYEDFAKNNWSTDPMRMGCTNSAYYYNNNILEIDNPSIGQEVKFNSYQNVPSLDQMSSLMVGLSLINKLVDDQFVKPTSADAGFYVVAETKAIVHRMVNFAANHNWFLIDVNGWPVGNGGGDLILTAYPIIKTATAITGNSYPIVIRRRTVGYHQIQDCETGYGLEELSFLEQNVACAQLSLAQIAHREHYLTGSGVAGPFNNQTTSLFQSWELTGNFVQSALSHPMETFWSALLPINLSAIYNDWEDDHKYNSFLPMLNLADLSIIEFDQPLIKDYSATILFNLGVTSGIWDQNTVSTWAAGTGNHQLELINAVLHDNTPTQPASFYRAYLDQMNPSGPYKMKGMNWHPNDDSIYAQETSHGNGWASEYRWTHTLESAGIPSGNNGMFSGIDYMLFHNLYWLKFHADEPMTETTDYCYCGLPVTAAAPAGANSFQIDANLNLNNKLSFLPSCVTDIFVPVNHAVTAVYTVQPKFSNYTDLGIYTTKYQTSNASVENGGELKTRTRFIICSQTLNVKAGGKMIVEKSETILNPFAVFDVSGEVRLKPGTILRLRSRMILRSGSKLIVESGAQLIIEQNGTIEYYNGADFSTAGDNSRIILRGTIRTMNATTFRIGTDALPNTSRGKLIIEGVYNQFEAMQTASFELTGTGINDNFIEIAANSRLLIADPEIQLFRINKCSVKLLFNASISAQRTFFSQDARYSSTLRNGGVTVAAMNSFLNCQFTDVPVKVPNTSTGSGFTARDCAFTSTSSAINPTDPALVAVNGWKYTISSSTFSIGYLYGIYSTNLVAPSVAEGCTFTKQPANTYQLTGIYDISTTDVKVSSSTFTDLYSGINKSSGKLNLKCNTFTGNTYVNITARNGCLLNMSTLDLAGYNVLNKSAQNRSIVLSASGINLKNGYNYIEQCPATTITGQTTLACVPPGCLLDFANNQWNSANTVPSVNAFQLTSAAGYIILPLVTTVSVKPACGFYDVTTPVDPGPKSLSLAPDGMPRFYSAIAGDTVRLYDAIQAGMHHMTAYDSLGNDLLAVEQFNELYATNDLDLTNAQTNTLLCSRSGR